MVMREKERETVALVQMFPLTCVLEAMCIHRETERKRERERERESNWFKSIHYGHSAHLQMTSQRAKCAHTERVDVDWILLDGF